MQNRGITLFLITTVLFIGLIFAQNYFFPPDKNAQAPAQQSEDGEEPGEDSQTGDASSQNSEAEADDPNSKNSGTAEDIDNQDASADTDQQGSDSSGDETPPANSDPTNSDSPGGTPPIQTDQYIGIGSMAADANNRIFATINRRGGTIRRVELNERLKNGRLKFRDVENKPGYLGNLELTTGTQGCRINFIGRGSPASAAICERGDQLERGDEILSVELPGREPTATPDVPAFFQAMDVSKPGQTIVLVVQKADTNLAPTKFQIELGEKPLEVLRPESYFASIPDSPESFQLTLVGTDSTVWNELAAAPALRKELWDVVEQSDSSVTLETKIQVRSPLPGTITVRKTYEVAPIETDNPLHSYHLNFDLEIAFAAEPEASAEAEAETLKLAYQLQGPTGTPVDGWWYQNKINGNAGSLFSAAGARDLVAETKGEGYTFLGGPAIVSEYGQKDRSKVVTQDVYTSQRPDGGQARYLGVDTQYFSAMLLPGENPIEDRGWKYFDSYSAYVWLPNGWTMPEEKRDRKALDISFSMFSNPIELADGQTFQTDFKIFVGPKDPQVLQEYDLGKLRSFGWFWFVSQPLCYLLRFFYWGFSLIGLPSYALAIILLTVLVRGAMIPISRKAALNAQMMQKLAPEMKAIAEKYKDDMEGGSRPSANCFRGTSTTHTVDVG